MSTTPSVRQPSAFDGAYDERRMARSARRHAIEARERAADDLSPTCPRCDDLRPIGSKHCAECGCRLTV